MNDDLDKAAREAVEAADNSEQLKLIAAVLQAQQLMQAVQPHQCQHQAPRQQFNAFKWLTIGGVVSVCALALAVASVAVAIGGVCATACLVVLRSLLRDFQNDR
ncbi:hypothetical protein HUT18_14035 [Streptomyces sp. NA04227]|uniref:hypothetical protein n=1 Tax=Streptomyces sp. NA04227 TaxID=2742136 RepID=UPI0015918320|nr:hypothetical protein [Streptomyces sp. NA04227]QKW07340.1 hypothetical protein HUT18_14035 [Streptomyces sp. NA04227]